MDYLIKKIKYLKVGKIAKCIWKIVNWVWKSKSNLVYFAQILIN
jgi:hypothetical protein